MSSWEEQWSRKKSTLPGARYTPARTPSRTHSYAPVQSRFGADPSVHYVSPQPVVMPQASGGGSFSNAIMLLLGGFAVGTLWGEGLINKALGGKHKE